MLLENVHIVMMEKLKLEKRCKRKKLNCMLVVTLHGQLKMEFFELTSTSNVDLKFGKMLLVDMDTGFKT